MEKSDIFSKSQDHWSPLFKREQVLIGNYQKMLDSRLSRPKAIKKIQDGRIEKVFKNTAYEDQKMHKSIFKQTS